MLEHPVTKKKGKCSEIYDAKTPNMYCNVWNATSARGEDILRETAKGIWPGKIQDQRKANKGAKADEYLRAETGGAHFSVCCQRNKDRWTT